MCRKALLIASIILGCTPQHSAAYPGPTSTVRWPSALFTINIDPINYPPNSPQATAIIYGFGSWTKSAVAGTSFENFYWVEPETTDVDDNYDLYNTVGPKYIADTNTLAETSWRTDPGNNQHYIEFDVAINSQIAWSTTPSNFPPYEQLSLELAARHEAGHAIGFHGEEIRPPRVAVMNRLYSWGSLSYDNLHADDRNGLRTFYPGPETESDVRVLGWLLRSDTNGRATPVPAITPVSVTSGQTIQVQYSLENLGTTSYGDTVEFYASPFTQISPTFDTRIGFDVISALPGALGGDAVIPIISPPRILTIPCGIRGQTYIGVHARSPSDATPNDNLFTLTTAEHAFAIAVTDLSPIQPEALQATGSCDRVALNWQDHSSDELHFNVYRDGDLVGTAPANTESFEDSPPQAGVSYTYTVRAENATCESDPATAQGQRRATPPKPLGVTATTSRCDKIVITWAGADAITGWHLYRGDQPVIPLHTVPPGLGPSWGDESANPNTPYEYWVLPFNDCGTGSTASDHVAGYRPTPPTTTANVLASLGDCGGINVSWTWSGSGQDSFQVFRGGTHVRSVPDTARSWFDAGPEAQSGPQSYQVKARYPGECFGPLSSPPAVGSRFKEVTYRVTASVVGAKFTDNGVETSIPMGGYLGTATTCTPSATRALAVEPTQTILGTRYCFDSWSDGGFRTHSITVTKDTSITLNLVPSGSGPKVYTAGAIVQPDLSDCRSPHVFQGDAVAPYGLLVYPGATLRFKTPSGNNPGPTFKVYGTVTATDATFETTDSSSSSAVAQWSGITMGSPYGGSFDLRGCTIQNANAAVATLFINGGSSDVQGSVISARVSGCTFANNAADIQLDFEHEYSLAARELRLVGNLFRAKEAVRVTGADRYWYPTEPNVSAVIDSNNFAIATNGSKILALSGGFTGQINYNNMGLAPSNTKGIILSARGSAYPSVGLTGNKFWYTTGRTVLEAPAVAGHPYLAAYYNDWGAYSIGEIGDRIYDWFDTMAENPPKAEVLFNPFTQPPGGGPGSGCPFVFSDQGYGELRLENSILGRSEMTSVRGELVDDALPLRSARRDEAGIVRLRIAESEEERDLFDNLRLAAVTVREGDQIGTDQLGRMVLVRFVEQTTEVKSWAGRNAPNVSPAVPDGVYRGEPGDSLELVCTPSGPVAGLGTRRIVVGMKPKPTNASSLPSTRLGVDVRVATDAEGSSWATSDPIVPRAIWSNAVLPLEISGANEPSRIRLVWNTEHTLGRVGIAEVVEPLTLADAPIRRAVHSREGDVLQLVSMEDAQAATLAPGEHLDLEFDAREAPPGATYVLLVHGRYDLRVQAPSEIVPMVYYMSQNRPNPFNPETEIEFGLPREDRVTLRIFDVAGRLVRTLVDDELPAGRHSSRWDGMTNLGTAAGSGVYFSEIRAGTFHERKRMILLR